jgi:colanic acid biosynthesis glycosyl transferase WcaI
LRVLFLNQYFPPDPAPTGILLREIANALQGKGHEVFFASAGQEYREGQSMGRQGGRMRRELGGLWRILMGGLKAGRVDAVVSATSPPLLVFVAALVAKLRGARHYHWLFDMYPELATALGEIKEGPMARMFSTLAQWAYREADCVVALDEDMAGRLAGRLKAFKVKVIAPWVFESLIRARTQAMGHGMSDGPEPLTWLYSGNLGRAHEWRTLLDTQRILEEANSGWKLIFQGGGPGWADAREYAEKIGLKGCEWRGYVPEEELPASLLKAAVLVVTQKPETQGLLWPSKLALVKTLPRRILWIGPTDGAIGRELGALPQAGIFQPGDAAAVAQWLGGQDVEIVIQSAAIQDPDLVRREGLKQWLGIITREPGF